MLTWWSGSELFETRISHLVLLAYSHGSEHDGKVLFVHIVHVLCLLHQTRLATDLRGELSGGGDEIVMH